MSSQVQKASMNDLPVNRGTISIALVFHRVTLDKILPKLINRNYLARQSTKDGLPEEDFLNLLLGG